MRQDSFGGTLENSEGVGIGGEFVGIDQAATGFVEGVAGEAIVDIELPGGLDGLAKPPYEAVYFCLGFFRARHGIRASQSGNVLTEGMSGNERVKIVLFIEVVAIVVPAAHVGAGSRHSLALAERLQKTIFVEMKE